MRVIGIGEVMVRLSSKNFISESSLESYIGGAEYNVMVNLSSMGIETSFITTIPDNAIGNKVITHAKSYGIDTSKIFFSGEKLGTYYSFIGNDYVPTSVIYDRKYSSFYYSEEYNYKELLKGYDLLHISGVVPAINDNTKEIALDAIKTAVKMGLKVSYDSNYRGKMWTQKQAGEFLKLVLPYCEIVFLGILDLQYLLDYKCNNLEEGYATLFKKYPNIKLAASTTRNILSQNHHEIRGNIYNGELHNSRVYDIKIVERIGTGDSFAAGILYGVARGLNVQKTIDFAVANGVIKHYVKGDNYMANVVDINNLIENVGGRIDR